MPQMKLTPGTVVRLARDGRDEIPYDEQLVATISRVTDSGEAEVEFLHEGEPAFDFWPIDEIDVQR